MIRTSGVTKAYSAAPVVDDVTVEIPSGGVTALVGPNGAGKSTLLSLIARLLPMDSGQVRVGDLDVTTCDTRELARRLAVLRQDNPLQVRLTVAELVSFGRFPHNSGHETAEDRRKVDDAIAWMDLADLRDRHLDEMSGGQRQRAFVAMVLAQDTEYLLLDEPLAALDIPHARAMLTQLRRAADELGKTVVVVVHDINFAAAWSDRIIALRDGRVVADGTPAEVVTPEGMEAVFGLRIPVEVRDGVPQALYHLR